MKKINFNVLKEKISSLNPKEIYSWPMAFQLGVGVFLFIVLVVLGVVFHLFDVQDELSTVIDKEEKLKQEFVEKKKQAVNLVLYKQQLEEITNASDALLKQLPNKSEIEKLLIDINQAGIGRGLQFELFKPEQEKLFEFYAELPIKIKVSGTYDALGNFTADVGQLSRVVIFTDLTITAKDSLVTMETLAKTFRYLDQDEILQQKIEKEKEKKKKAKKQAPPEKSSGGHGA